MRVISGESGGRRLSAPVGENVRPTSDRVREAIFDILYSLGGVDDLHVLDLFAGTGALGIEALSRGAASVTFVERDLKTVDTVRANLTAVGLGEAFHGQRAFLALLFEHLVVPERARASGRGGRSKRAEGGDEGRGRTATAGRGCQDRLGHRTRAICGR